MFLRKAILMVVMMVGLKGCSTAEMKVFQKILGRVSQKAEKMAEMTASLKAGWMVCLTSGQKAEMKVVMRVLLMAVMMVQLTVG